MTSEWAGRTDGDELDGVRVIWPAGGARREAETAALWFRVGQADEALQTRGITHLVEHLALVRSGLSPHAYHGQTGLTLTNFMVHGSGAELTDFLRTVTESLSALPLDRLELERGVLATEEQMRAGDADSLWRMRWGPRRHGLLGYPEYGAQRADGDTLRAWAERWFTRQNAVLVLDGTPPPGLRLQLPDGAWQPPHEPGPAVDALPMTFVVPGESLGLSILRDRGHASSDAAWLISERLNQALRFELGLVYGVQDSSSVLTAQARHDVSWTHALPTHVAAAGQALVNVVSRIAEPMSEAERAKRLSHRGRLDRADPGDRQAAYLTYVAHQILLGGQVLSERDLKDGERTVSEDDILAAIGRSMGQLILALPPTADPRGVATPVAEYSNARLSGRHLAPTRGSSDELILADDGLTLVHREGERPVTVRYADVAAVLAWDDGARTLLGNDGFGLTYQPEQWTVDPAEVIRAIDGAVDSALFIWQGERLGTVVPASSPAPAEQHHLLWWLLFGARMMGGLILLLSAPAALADDDPPASLAHRMGVCLLMLVFAAALLWQPARYVRRRDLARRVSR